VSASGVRVVSDTRGAGLRALKGRVEKLRKHVLVGVPAGKHEADGTPLALVAAANEFGTSTIPERSFLRSGIHEHMPEFVHLSGGLLPRVADGSMSEDLALDIVGIAAAAAVKTKIIDGPFEENAPATKQRKKSDRPLVDSGALRQGITHVVEGSR
jgi:hypothetical protein